MPTAHHYEMLFSPGSSCVSPEAVKTDIQGIRNDMGQLESVAEELSVWKKSVQAETINYGGAGWVVIGTGAMALIFVGAGLLLVRAFMRRGNMLTMLTRAVKNAGEDSPDFVHVIKSHLKRCVREGHFCEADRKNLGHFANKRNNFAHTKK